MNRRKKQTYFVAGLGRFGLSVVKILSEMNADIIAMDTKSDACKQADDYITAIYVADSTKLDVLKEKAIDKCTQGIVAIGNNLSASILTVMNLKKLNPDMRITVRSDTHDYDELFYQLGVKDIIVPEERAAEALAKSIASDSILDYYTITEGVGMVKVAIRSDYAGETIAKLNLVNKYDISIVGIIRNDEFIIPRGSESIEPDDYVYIVGKDKGTTKFDKDFGGGK